MVFFLLLVPFQTLTKEAFDSISSSSKQLLTLALQELEVNPGTSALSKHIQFEHNVALFLWSESSSDLPADAAWVNVANRGQFAKSGLSMKAQALTPCVQSFCSALDSKLKARLDDLLSYLPADPKEVAPVLQPRSAFNRYADAGTVEGLLRDRCVACIQHMLGCVHAELQSAQSLLGGQADAPSDARLNTILFMARLCQSLPELCPHLKQCILGQAGSAETALKETRSGKKLGKGKAQEVTPVQAKWQGVKAELLQQSLLAYQIWSSAVTKVRSWFLSSQLLPVRVPLAQLPAVSAVESSARLQAEEVVGWAPEMPFRGGGGMREVAPWAGAGCPSFGAAVGAGCDQVLCFALQGLVQCFTRTLLLDTAGSVLATATNWDEIEIQEETESGNSVTSKIRLPVQV